MAEPVIDARVFNTQWIPTTVPLQAALAATLVPITFTQNVPPYAGGETASFLPEHAAALVAAGLAQLAGP